MIAPIIRTEEVSKIFRTGDTHVHALNGVSLAIPTGKMTAIVGRSGAGKTTFLNLVSGLDKPSSGKVFLQGQDLFSLSEDDRVRFRLQNIAFVFQNFGLLPLLSAEENVGVPLRMMEMPRQEREQRVLEALEWVGLSKRIHHRPYELSGGEQQRVAIARALAARPKIILADEPTGQLDSQTGQRIIATMNELAEQLGVTLLIVTHDPLVMQAADHVFQLHDGRLLTTHDEID